MNYGTTGHGPSRFGWLTEMGELIGGQHDVNFVATGTAQGVTVHRPEVLLMGSAGRNSITEASSTKDLLSYHNHRNVVLKRTAVSEQSSSSDHFFSTRMKQEIYTGTNSLLYVFCTEAASTCLHADIPGEDVVNRTELINANKPKTKLLVIKLISCL